MLEVLLSLLILVVIFAVVWWIFGMVPVPAEFRWLVNVIIAVIFLIALIALLTGSYTLFPAHGLVR
jgi:hypothetical protein